MLFVRDCANFTSLACYFHVSVILRRSLFLRDCAIFTSVVCYFYIISVAIHCHVASVLYLRHLLILRHLCYFYVIPGYFYGILIKMG